MSASDTRYLHLIRQDCPLPPGTHVVIYCRDSGGEEQDRSVQQQIDTAREYCASDQKCQLLRQFPLQSNYVRLRKFGSEEKRFAYYFSVIPTEMAELCAVIWLDKYVLAETSSSFSRH